MKKFGLTAGFVLALIVLPPLAQPALSCSCSGPATGPIALQFASVVFTGRAVSGDVQTITFQVDKMWKGADRSEITMLTGARVFDDGRLLSRSSCDMNYSLGTEYLVYASGPPEELTAGACSRTAPVQEEEVRALDAVLPHRKVGNDVHSCASAPAHEIRLTTANTSKAGIPDVRLAIEGPGKRIGAVTNAAGQSAIAELSAGEYRITAELEGFAPRRLTIPVAVQGCVEATIYLLPILEPVTVRRPVAAVGPYAGIACRSGSSEGTPMSLTGVVTKVEWQAPQVLVVLMAKDQTTGKTTPVSVELGPKHALLSLNPPVLRETFQIGDRLTASGIFKVNSNGTGLESCGPITLR